MDLKSVARVLKNTPMWSGAISCGFLAAVLPPYQGLLIGLMVVFSGLAILRTVLLIGDAARKPNGDP